VTRSQKPGREGRTRDRGGTEMVGNQTEIPTISKEKEIKNLGEKKIVLCEEGRQEGFRTGGKEEFGLQGMPSSREQTKP